jgi:hypothetical protein
MLALKHAGAVETTSTHFLSQHQMEDNGQHDLAALLFAATE